MTTDKFQSENNDSSFQLNIEVKKEKSLQINANKGPAEIEQAGQAYEMEGKSISS